MSENLHDIDDLFRSALEENEVAPSASVKESLIANLDKKDTESYKKRFIVWKRAAIVLVLLLAGIIIHDSGILKTGSGDSAKKNIIQKTATDAGPSEENEIKNNQYEYPGTVTNRAPVSDDNKAARGKENSNSETISNDDIEINREEENKKGDFNTIPATESKSGKNKNWAKQKNNTVAKRIKSPGKIKKQEVSVTVSKDDNPVINDMAVTGKNLKKAISNLARFDDKNNRVKFSDDLPARLQHPVLDAGKQVVIGFKLPAVIDSLLKSYAANNNSLKKIHHFKSYWTLTGLVTYDRVNYKLDSDLPDNITTIKHREVHEPSFSVGLMATRQVKEHWGLQTGLVYSNTAIGISPQKIFALQDPAGDIAYKYITSSGYAYIKPGFGSPASFGDSLTTTEAKHSLQSVSIPVIIKYTIGKNKFLLIPGAGLEANFITRAKLVTEIEDGSNRETVFINKLNGAKSFYWSLTADAELRYFVNKKLAFSLRPMFRFAISTITDNNVVETYPYSFGAGLGLTYKF